MSSVETGILNEDTQYSYPGAADDLVGTDIYKVHHHGSNTSSGANFLNKLSPKIAVPIDGGTSSSHPNRDALDRLISGKAVIYRPDMDGNVTVKMDSAGNYDVVRTVVYPQLPWAGFDNRDSAYSDKAPPALPGGLTVLSAGKNNISLDWSDTTKAADGSSITSAYHVFRSTISGGDPGAGTDLHQGMSGETGIYRQLTFSPVNMSEYEDSSIELDKRYYYRVSAVRTDCFYERRYSNQVKADTHFDPPGQIVDLTALPGLSDRQIELSWSAPGETGDEGNNRPGSCYTLKYATYTITGSPSAISGWWDKAALYRQDWDVSPRGDKETKTIENNFNFNTTYYFGIKTSDAFGNTSVISSTPTPGTRPRVDVTSPEVVETEISPQPSAEPVGCGAYVKLGFSEGVSSETIKKGVYIRETRDNLSYSIEGEMVSFSVIEESSASYRLQPSELLKKGYLYTVTVTTEVKDLAAVTHPGDIQHPLGKAFSWEFSIVMDKDKRNRSVSPDGTEVLFLAGTFKEDYRVEISRPVPDGKILAANKNLRAMDPLASPLSVREFKIYGASGNSLNGRLSLPAEIYLPCEYLNEYEQKTASIWRLDEASGMWVRLAESGKTGSGIRAAVYHFSVFGLMTESQMDLAGAYAYPVPFKPNDGLTITGTQSEGIKFRELSSRAKINIYTLSGEHVRTLDYDYTRDTEPFVWNTLDSAGKKVSSGLYIYSIKNKESEKSGRLVIIR
jgi:hypothetical protein